MNYSVIIGNGINYFLAEKLQEEGVDKHKKEKLAETAERIIEITRLWEKFDALFKELAEKTNNTLNQEQIIGLINSVLEFFKNREAFGKLIPEEVFKILEKSLDESIFARILEISQEFMDYHNSGEYRVIKSIFPKFGENLIGQMEKSGVQKMTISSTNYDGIFDTILTGNPYGFLFEDCFSRALYTSDFLEIQPGSLLNSDRTIMHIHGSYLYEKIYGTTLKKKKYENNQNPSMVFNDPSLKFKTIKSDYLLRNYYDKFESELSKSDVLVIVGNSMKTEPHIKNSIQRFFNKDKAIIRIVDPNPEQVAKNLEGFYTKKFDLIASNSVKSSDDLILKIF